jgi:4-amino-4-deoxy-L-arabinose transferase-like glycosyltransferase
MTWIMRFPSRQFAGLLLVLAFAVRLGAVLAMRDITLGPVGESSADDVQFNNLALRLAAAEGYVSDQGKPTSFRAPGFPFLLAGLYVMTGEQPVLVYLMLCMLGALACVLTYLLARELVPEMPARVAGLLACVYLGHIYFSTVYFSENLFVPSLVLGLWSMIRYLKGGSPWWLAAAGLVLGWATLVRPFAILLLPLCLLVLAWHEWRARRWGVRAAVFGACFLAVLLPWTYRNYHVHDRFVLVATNGGSTFYGGNNQRVVSEARYFGYWISTTDLPHRDLIDATPDEVAHDKMEWKLGLDWLENNPGQVPRLLLFKLARMWWLPEFDAGRFYYLVRIAGHVPFLILFAVGFWHCFRRAEYHSLSWLLVHAASLATVITVLVFWGCTRFRDANHPFLMLYAAVGLEALVVGRRALPKIRDLRATGSDSVPAMQSAAAE